MCFLQRHVRPRPVSAAILHVGVEEEAVEVVADVVMMLDVGARPALAVDRADPRRHPFGAPPEPRLVEQLRAAIPRRVHANERDEFRSEEHTSELQSLMRISYAVFCLKKKNKLD